jgi:hypothetical protein
MRGLNLAKYFLFCLCALLSVVSALATETPKQVKQAAAGSAATAETAQLLPARLGDFSARASVGPYGLQMDGAPPVDDASAVLAASRTYRSPDGASFTIRLKKMGNDAAAYALLTGEAAALRAAHTPAQVAKLEQTGTLAFTAPGVIAFFKGPVFARVEYDRQAGAQAALALAQQLAATLDKGTGEIPPLIEHLPAGVAQERAVYAVSLSGLQATVRNQPVLEAVSFAGGTEAVAAQYEQGQLVIVEFQTPQLATDNDERIVGRIAELRRTGQSVPAAYRREGNYAVFVFAAPSEQAANALLEQVKYEKVVQWLGEDPHRTERANRLWLNMSSSLIINSVKATGLAILLCLGVGGLFGGVVFMRRRAQTALSQQYTDAGGMMRLNLDELAAESVRPQLLPPPDK